MFDRENAFFAYECNRRAYAVTLQRYRRAAAQQPGVRQAAAQLAVAKLRFEMTLWRKEAIASRKAAYAYPAS